MQQLEFVKMHGIGNDFIIADFTKSGLKGLDLGRLAVRMCDRNFGVGADGVLLVLPSETADFRMRLINSDGSEAEMCGNGVRVVAKYLFDRGMCGESVTVETLGGTKVMELEARNGTAVGATVNMGAPRLDARDIPVSGYRGKVINRPLEVDGVMHEITCVSMGNPHCVLFVDAVEEVPLEKLGPRLETHPAFPQKTNVEFAQVVKPDDLIVRVFERGAGVTLACGTGACASVVAGVLTGRCGRQATVHLPGGKLLIDWREDGDVYMTGPAEEVFIGTYPL